MYRLFVDMGGWGGYIHGMTLKTLRKRLEGRDKTMEQIARDAGVCRATLYKIRNGHKPRTRTMNRIVKAIG